MIDPYGMPFHTVSVFGLGLNLLWESDYTVLEHNVLKLIFNDNSYH